MQLLLLLLLLLLLIYFKLMIKKITISKFYYNSYKTN